MYVHKMRQLGLEVESWPTWPGRRHESP